MSTESDRELLELAAKAAGIEVVRAEIKGLWIAGGMGRHWNPLTDDGDALRLAVKLNMGISIPVWKDNRVDVITFKLSSVNVIERGQDAMANVRRAIVRAAAAIGKSM